MTVADRQDIWRRATIAVGVPAASGRAPGAGTKSVIGQLLRSQRDAADLVWAPV